jgi:sugar phosphate isomerase/epimerase
MDLKIFKSLWGMSGPLEQQIEQIAEAGYDGVESCTQECNDIPLLKQLLAKNKLDYISLLYTEGDDHGKSFEERARQAAELNPVRIVAHGGRDTMSYVKQVRFFIRALRVEEAIGIPVAHETHRRRPFYSPINTLPILRELPELRLNIDYSHWCCVTESMLEDHSDAMEISAERAIHLHGRIGFENGPQVPDPRAPEWEGHVKKHEAWWNPIIEAHRARKESLFTFTPEFGPPSYMPTVPYKNEPTASLWDVCLWSAERFRKQFSGA